MPRLKKKPTETTEPLEPTETTTIEPPLPVKSKHRVKADAKIAAEKRTDILEWIHLHTLEAISIMTHHSRVIERLREESMETIPNLLFYGSVGFPLEYMAYALIVKTTMPTKNVCLWENKLPYCECPYFFEIQCRHPDMPKEYGILCDFMKHILNTHCIHQKKHVFILRDIDVICQSEYHYALRVLLERYSHNVLFIATTHSLSKIEAPLLSRFMLIRTPQPSVDDINCIRQHFIGHAAHPESILQEQETLTPKTFVEQMYLIRAGALPEDKKQLETFILQTPSPSYIDIRYYAYRCFQKGIPFAKYCFMLIQYCRYTKYKTKLLSELTHLEHQLMTSSHGREPIYYEKALWMTIFANSLWK